MREYHATCRAHVVNAWDSKCGALRSRLLVNQTAKAPPPCFYAAPGTPSFLGRSATPGEEPRARGTPGVHIGPAGLDASRHRGLSKSLCLAFRSGSSDRQSVPQVRQTQGVPRAVFNRLAPHRPRWSAVRHVFGTFAAAVECMTGEQFLCDLLHIGIGRLGLMCMESKRLSVDIIGDLPCASYWASLS